MTSVEDLFARAVSLIEADPPQNEQVLPILNEILQQEPDDPDALQAKVVCLIQLSKYDQALDMCTNKPALKECTFEKAYCLYRLNRNAEAIEIVGITAKPKEDVRFTQLRAQVLYRLGRYSDSAEVYANIDDDIADPAELAVNRSAALCAAGESAKAAQVLKATASMLKQTPDMLYNLACALIEKGDMESALTALDDAENLFESQAQEDGVSAEEIEDGKIVFQVQRAFVKQRLGQSEAALEAYEDALKQKPSDAEVAAVASNNLFALRGKEQHLFDSAKKAKALNLEERVESKLTVHQRRVFSLNRCLLALYTNNVKECTKGLLKLEKEFEGSELPTLVKAALLAREKKMEECRALLQAHAEENPKTATLVKLTLAQLQLNEGDKAGAIKALESIEGVHKLLGVVGTVVRLHESLKDTPRAIQSLEATVKAVEAEKPGKEDVVRRLMLVMSELYVKGAEHKKAVQMLEKVVKGGEKDPAVVARLVSVCAEEDVALAEKYAELLAPLEDSADMDVQELESFQRAAPARERDAGGDAGQADGGAEQKKRKQRKKKKEHAVVATADGKEVTLEAYHLPKKYAELVEMGSWGKPDPERWLPWHQRSYNRKILKKRKGLGTASGGSQGGQVSAAAAAALDRTEKFQTQLAQQAAAGDKAPAPAPAPAAGSSSSKYKKKGKK